MKRTLFALACVVTVWTAVVVASAHTPVSVDASPTLATVMQAPPSTAARDHDTKVRPALALAIVLGTSLLAFTLHHAMVAVRAAHAAAHFAAHGWSRRGPPRSLVFAHASLLARRGPLCMPLPWRVRACNPKLGTRSRSPALSRS